METRTPAEEYVHLPIHREIYAHLLLRDPEQLGAGIPQTIENVLWDYLDRTQSDRDWNETYEDLLQRKESDDAFQFKFGDPKGGYIWGRLFLPNGTQLRMRYKGEDHFATVKHEAISYGNDTFSPSQLCHRISGTPRNAWRCLHLRRPNDHRWYLADDLRRTSSR